MFKKFKDKLAEEMKQSPARLQASMQQLVQVVPGITNNSTSDLSASNDNFSLTEGDDETPRNTPDKYKLHAVDLTSYSSNSMGLSRTSSVNSVTSFETSGLFPIYESPGSTYHLQSDMDQSASEIDEHINPQFDQVSKEQIYAAYRKVQTKYHKYRGRYTDLVNYYREMERAKCKLESLLVETQDKALRRIADLKEQCQLEQQAKAHLEDALRNDIEEKDHIIDTLNTKVKLLQANGSSTLISLQNQENLIDIGYNKDISDGTELYGDISSEQSLNSDTINSSVQSQLAEENQQLKNKLSKLEIIIMKYKDSLKRSKDKIFEITQDKSILERDMELIKNSNNEQFESMTERLNEAKAEIIISKEKINTMKRAEEESAISLAENKLSIHRELEIKEEQIKQLTLELKNAIQDKDNARMMMDNNSEINNTTKNAHDNIDVEKYLHQEETIKSLNDMVEASIIEINEAKEKIQAQNNQINQLTEESKENYEKLYVDFKIKCDDSHKLENELMKCRSIIDQLNDKLNDNTKTNDYLIKQKNNLIENLANCMTTVHSLRNNYHQLKSQLKNDKIQQKENFLEISQLIQETLCNYQSHSNITCSNEQIKSYESELEEKNTEIINMITKLNDLEDENSKLNIKLDNVNSEIVNITREYNNNENYIKEIINEKDLIDNKYQEIQLKYTNQLGIIEAMEKELAAMKQLSISHEEIIDQYNNEKQYLMESAEQAINLQVECRRLNEEMADKTTNFNNKISTIESENEIYKNNLAECTIQLNNITDKYNEILMQYENLKLEIDHNKMLLHDELTRSHQLIDENSKYSHDKSVLNIQIQNLTDMINAKNEFIEILKHCKVKSAKIIQERDIEIMNLLTAKESIEESNKFVINERLHLNDNYTKRIEQLINEKTELTNTNMELISTNAKYRDIEEKYCTLLAENDEIKSKFNRQQEINDSLECQIQESNKLVTIIEELKSYKEKSEDEKKELKNVENELLKANQELQDGKNLLEEQVDELQTLSQIHLKEIDNLKKEIEQSREIINNDSKFENDRLHRVIDELQLRLQEKESIVIACQAARLQIENVNGELKNEVEKLREQLSTFETEQTLRMQQLVKEFQARLQDKDTELQAALDQKFDWQKNYESELVQQYREQLRDFQIELTAKSEEIEHLKMKKIPDNNKEIEKLVETIATIKLEHANELKDTEMKWLTTLNEKCNQLEAKHNIAINELTNEWKKSKFTDENISQKSKELGNMAAMAMTAVQCDTGVFDSMQQMLYNQRRELIELRKLVNMRHDTLDDSTEIEYLRNILYEYMMGKETLVLARVIAAVVKFDHDQTNKILKKEEDKLTLLGSLGLS